MSALSPAVSQRAWSDRGGAQYDDVSGADRALDRPPAARRRGGPVPRARTAVQGAEPIQFEAASAWSERGDPVVGDQGIVARRVR